MVSSDVVRAGVATVTGPGVIEWGGDSIRTDTGSVPVGSTVAVWAQGRRVTIVGGAGAVPSGTTVYVSRRMPEGIELHEGDIWLALPADLPSLIEPDCLTNPARWNSAGFGYAWPVSSFTAEAEGMRIAWNPSPTEPGNGHQMPILRTIRTDLDPAASYLIELDVVVDGDPVRLAQPFVYGTAFTTGSSAALSGIVRPNGGTIFLGPESVANPTTPGGVLVTHVDVVEVTGAEPESAWVYDEALARWVLLPSGGGGTPPSGDGPPTGSVTAYAPATGLPSGWLECDGSVVSRTQYAALFAAIGTTYGPGDGSATFALPDLRNRFALGLDGGTDPGDTGGQAAVSLTTAQLPAHTHGGPGHTHPGPSHTHTIAHNHTLGFSDAAGGSVQNVPKGTSTNSSTSAGLMGQPSSASSGAGGTQSTGPATSGVTGSTGSGETHENMPPYLVLRFIIKT